MLPQDTSISYKDHVTNEEVRAKIQQLFGPPEDLLNIVKKRKLKWYGHVSCSSDLAKTVLQCTVKGGRRQGGQKRSGKTTPGNGQAWSLPSPRGQWRTGEKMEETVEKSSVSHPSSCMLVNHVPTQQIFNLRILCQKYLLPSKTFTMPSQTSSRHSTGFDMHFCEQPRRSTIHAPTLSES